MHARGLSKWYIYAETFVLVMTMTYLCFVVFEVVYSDDMKGEFTLAANEVAEAAAAYAEADANVCSEVDEKCAGRLSVMSTSFILAFMAGGFMNFERIQGLPIP